MPKYLYREQYQKCIDVFKDLYEWTNDPFLHTSTAFHEIALYYFLLEMENLKEDIKEDFIEIYYDKEMQKEIDTYIAEDLVELGEDFDIDILEKQFYDPADFFDEIFEDLDFLELPLLYNEQKLNMPILQKILGINIDYYFDILPIDIQKQYKTGKITLTGEISDFFHYMQERINHGSLSELFWEQDKPGNEKKVQIVLENIMDAYFCEKGVDISREVLIKNGQVDFKLFRSNVKDEKILIEVKKASSSYLKAGYEQQLCDYIAYSGCKNAFYLIICFTDHDYKIANNFIRNHVYTDTFQMYINIAILDVRKKLSPSHSKKKH
jgi:hypothetical protein